MREQLHECLACEQDFTTAQAITAGTTPLLGTQYCSAECEREFEGYLETSVEQAKELNKLLELAAIENPSNAERELVTKMVAGFSLKIPNSNSGMNEK